MPEKDPIARLVSLRARPMRRILGLNTGTSADGIDAALVEIEGAGDSTRARLAAFAKTPLPGALQGRLRQVLVASTEELCDLNVALGHELARAALELVASAGMSPGDVDLVGSHGQTACHHPPSGGWRGATLQIGEAAVVAERLGVPVVCDFRARDVAAGGEGAPLVPLADYYLFRRPGGTAVALQNIGGIANVTVVTERLDDVFAFDTGPGNMALDEVSAVATGGAESFDRDGLMAARGEIDGALVAELLALPFFALPPPRSTGREAFGAAWVKPLLERFAGRLDDLLATLTRVTAEAIRKSYVDHVLPKCPVTEVLVSGGGVHNQTLMRHLAELLAPLPVRSTAALGVPPDAKEAIAFAILANETLFGLPGNVPRATGAGGPRVLGKIVPP